MPRVTEQHKERRRQAILDAAQSVFLGKGYQLATIDDIAGRSGLSVGALYRYFQTKSDIMLVLLEQRLGRTPELFARLTADAGTPWERLERCVDLFVSALRVKHPATGKLLLVAWGEALHDSEVRRGLQRRFAALVQYLASVIREGVGSGQFRTDCDPDALAANLLCAADGLTLYWSVETPQLDVRALRAAMLAMLRAYLTQTQPGER